MFTIDIVLGVLKKVFGSVFSFLWEYKGWILLGVIVGALYVRGNNYRDDYQKESVAHANTVLQYNKQLSDIRLANEKALRVAQEESTANYKFLVEKTSLIQEKYNERNKDIDDTITKLNTSNISLHQTIKDFTKRDTNSSTSSVSDSTDAYRLQKLGGLLETCTGRKQYYAEESARLSNSVNTLQEWAEAVIEQSKKENYE